MRAKMIYLIALLVTGAMVSNCAAQPPNGPEESFAIASALTLGSNCSLLYESAETTVEFGPGEIVIARVENGVASIQCQRGEYIHKPHPRPETVDEPAEALQQRYGEVPMVVQEVELSEGDLTQRLNNAVCKWEAARNALRSKVQQDYVAEYESDPETFEPDAAAARAVETLLADELLVASARAEEPPPAAANEPIRVLLIRWAGLEDEHQVTLWHYVLESHDTQQLMTRSAAHDWLQTLRWLGMDQDEPIRVELRKGKTSFFRGGQAVAYQKSKRGGR